MQAGLVMDVERRRKVVSPDTVSDARPKPVADIVTQAALPRAPFRDRFRYMHAELEAVHRARASRRRWRLLRRLKLVTWRERVTGAIALAAALVLVILLIKL